MTDQTKSTASPRHDVFLSLSSCALAWVQTLSLSPPLTHCLPNICKLCLLIQIRNGPLYILRQTKEGGKKRERPSGNCLSLDLPLIMLLIKDGSRHWTTWRAVITNYITNSTDVDVSALCVCVCVCAGNGWGRGRYRNIKWTKLSRVGGARN